MSNVPCPACGAPTACNYYESWELEAYCTQCSWVEGGPDDFGFLTMDERPFALVGEYEAEAREWAGYELDSM